MILRNRYELGEMLGEGAFGKTYAARDRSTGGELVVKHLALVGLPDWKPVEYFEREVKVLRSLSHPAIPRLIDAFDEDANLYIISERVLGETLAHGIERGDRWDPDQAMSLAGSLLAILDYLHTLCPPVVHRDIKPENIIVRPDGSPAIIDFGAVLDAAARGSATRLTVMGTPGYMAPEQAMGNADARADLYALGATLLHVLTHRAPMDLPRDHLHFLFAEIPGLPDSLLPALESLTHPDPGLRFQSAKEALAALQNPPPRPISTALATRHDRSTALAAANAPRPLTKLVKRQLGDGHLLRLDATAGLTTVGLLGSAIGVIGMVGVAAIPFAIAGSIAGMIAVARVRRGRDRALYTDGVHILGAVLASRRPRMASSDRTGSDGVYVEYRYQVADQEYLDDIYVDDVLVINELRIGMPVSIFYDPKSPKRHVALVEPETRGFPPRSNLRG